MRYNLFKTVFDQLLAFCLIRSHVYSRTWDSTGRLMDAAGLGQDRTVRKSQAKLTTGHPLPPLDRVPHDAFGPAFPPLVLLLHLRD